MQQLAVIANDSPVVPHVLGILVIFLILQQKSTLYSSGTLIPGTALKYAGQGVAQDPGKSVM